MATVGKDRVPHRVCTTGSGVTILPRCIAHEPRSFDRGFLLLQSGIRGIGVMVAVQVVMRGGSGGGAILAVMVSVTTSGIWLGFGSRRHERGVGMV